LSEKGFKVQGGKGSRFKGLKMQGSRGKRDNDIMLECY